MSCDRNNTNYYLRHVALLLFLVLFIQYSLAS
jgi:hypothetical protein